ncbi:sacsin N-terminal ATP-binding-like domain-containing protein [Thermodesulfobacteriota bacterium]
MATIKKAIEEFRQKRCAVYHADPQQIVRDTRGAERAIKDHTSRWLFELLQNSDDAEAPEVRILVEDTVIYVADNGRGLTPTAVSAICGTDFSDKPSGTIGRKGVGFKSVYEISNGPQVLTVNGDGVEFSPSKTTEWLKKNAFDKEYIPYQWIPFYMSWNEAQQNDTILETLSEFKTVVRLPIYSLNIKKKVEQLLKDWPPHALFSFRHVRKLHAPQLKINLSPNQLIWKMDDSRKVTPSEWRVVESDSEQAPKELIKNLGIDERKAIIENGVGFLVAAPQEDNFVIPTEDYLPVHVFYPTEEIGPVRLLLHAEFLVKSDRTTILPISNSPFNSWVADRLALRVCDFVNGSYSQENPSGNVALLLPFEGRESHPVAQDLWECLAQKARKLLRIADVDCERRLKITEAKLISVSIHPELARILLEATDAKKELLHKSFDDDADARLALTEMGCEEIQDSDLIETVANHADLLCNDTEWVWTCWKWLAYWIDEEFGQERKERLNQIKNLPIVPVGGLLLKPSSLAGHIVTWKLDALAEKLPDWLPLTYIDDWFRDHLQLLKEKDDPINILCKNLGIKEPGTDVVQRAVGKAIEQFWKDWAEPPERFLSFILKQKWHETTSASSALKRCPVPLAKMFSNKKWAEADNAYLGGEWDNKLLTNLYLGVEGLFWVKSARPNIDTSVPRQIFEWLGVVKYPRIINTFGEKNIWDFPEEYGDWKIYIKSEEDSYGRSVERVTCCSDIDYTDIGKLDHKRAISLIRLIATYWDDYFADKAKMVAYGTKGREQYYRTWLIKSKWWWEVCEKLSLPIKGGRGEHVPLTKCWILDKRTARTMGPLLPVVDLGVYADDKNIVKDWFIGVVGLRTQTAQLTLPEWKELLVKDIPNKAPSERVASNKRLRDYVTGWYDTCLETIAEQDNTSDDIFTTCRLLCIRGDSWQYTTGEQRYFDDDNNIAKAFTDDVWFFNVSSKLSKSAEKYFGVLPISKAVDVKTESKEPKSLLHPELQEKFNESLPYVWAWRSSQSKLDLNRLKSLKVYVVEVLTAHLNLNGVCHNVEQRWSVIDGHILLHMDHANETELAQALAKAVEIKSEADFYENLFRCKSSDQRKEKLLSKGIPDAEIDRYLRLYSESPVIDLEERNKEKTTKKAGKKVSDSDKPKESNQETKHPGETPKEQLSESPAKPEPQKSTNKQPIRLKNAYTTDYATGEIPYSKQHDTGGGASGGGSPYTKTQPLTDKEKLELEEAGRRIAVRELESRDYIVEEMPQNNPGFDLLGKKGSDELRVEVKAHLGTATVVDVTHRQYIEYLGQNGYRWELWNVEHLAEDDTQQPVITKYDSIPEEALDARTYRVDLKKCHTPGKE